MRPPRLLVWGFCTSAFGVDIFARSIERDKPSGLYVQVFFPPALARLRFICWFVHRLYSIPVFHTWGCLFVLDPSKMVLFPFGCPLTTTKVGGTKQKADPWEEPRRSMDLGASDRPPPPFPWLPIGHRGWFDISVLK